MSVQRQDTGDNHVRNARILARCRRQRRRRPGNPRMARRAGRRHPAEGGERAHFLLEQLIEEARQSGIDMPFSANTGYVNTIEPDDEERSPGNLELEGRLRAYMRWNAMALVVKANRLDPADGGDLGGHISSLRLGGAHVRRRLQPLLARRERRPWRRPALHPGPQRARHLCARLHGRPADRGAAAQLPPGSRTARACRATRTRS